MSALASLLPGVPLLEQPTTHSTNTDARAWLLRGAAFGSLVTAQHQTGGRGRMGRVFVSQPGGLYMSVILPPDHPAGQVTTLCAVAVRRAVQQLSGISLDIKWVNDLLLGDKKVCGILCEGVWEGNQCLGIIAGIGLNVCQTSFPEELAPIVRSLYPNGQPPCDIAHFAAAIHREIMALLPESPAHMAEYRTHCLTLGRQIWWQQGDTIRTGFAQTTDDDGGLIVQTDAGVITISAGEVSVRPLE